MTFNVMLIFATRHGAGTPKINFRYVFVPIHTIFAFLFFIGNFSKNWGAYCTHRTYPDIFIF